MLALFHSSGNLPKNRLFLKHAPYPTDPAASVYSWSASLLTCSSYKKKAFPLKLDKNSSQTKTSSCASLFIFTKWCNSLTPMERFISLRKKVLPGLMTEHAKFNNPNKERSFFKVQVVLFYYSNKSCLILIILSSGRQAFIRSASRVIPMKSITSLVQMFF